MQKKKKRAPLSESENQKAKGVAAVGRPLQASYGRNPCKDGSCFSGGPENKAHCRDNGGDWERREGGEEGCAMNERTHPVARNLWHRICSNSIDLERIIEGGEWKTGRWSSPILNSNKRLRRFLFLFSTMLKSFGHRKLIGVSIF